MMTEDGFLEMGDIGEIDSMGCLIITGCIKELFKILKGNYVALALIETKLVTNLRNLHVFALNPFLSLTQWCR
jgi:long-subunit acyl-CoA synthetase (AMP-forming)